MAFNERPQSVSPEAANEAPAAISNEVLVELHAAEAARAELAPKSEHGQHLEAFYKAATLAAANVEPVEEGAARAAWDKKMSERAA